MTPSAFLLCNCVSGVCTTNESALAANECVQWRTIVFDGGRGYRCRCGVNGLFANPKRDCLWIKKHQIERKIFFLCHNVVCLENTCNFVPETTMIDTDGGINGC